MSKSLMIGYLESWADPGITFTEAAEKGFDAIVMAFGSITGDKVSIFNNQFVPSGSKIKTDINNAKASGAKQIICSFGGDNEHNTYNPGDTDPSLLAKNIVSFLQEYGFTGIDFDLEIETSGEYLDLLCAALQKEDSSILITAAPQLNQGEHDSNVYFVSTGNAQIFQQALENNRFNYVFVQAYNNQWPKLNQTGETDAGFISESFNNLKQTVPAQTLIAIGEPANQSAAGTSIFTTGNTPKDIYQQIADQYEKIKSDPQFGGAMVWNINKDANTQDQFINAVGPVINNSQSYK